MPIWDTAHTFPEQYVRPRRHPDLLGNSDLAPISLFLKRSTIMATELPHPFVTEIRVVHTLFALSAWLRELSQATEVAMRLGEDKEKVGLHLELAVGDDGSWDGDEVLSPGMCSSCTPFFFGAASSKGAGGRGEPAPSASPCP